MFKPYADPDKLLTDRQSQLLPNDKKGKGSHPFIYSKRYDEGNDKMNEPGCASGGVSGPLEKEKKRKAVRGCISGFTVCLGLISYTFLGAVLFVMIEGEGFADKNNRIANDELLTASFGSESRERAVENIWEITVNLNILYRENWTKLASQEISRFQEKLIQHLSKELGHTNEKEKDVQGSGGKDTNWDLARSLLYSITILTTTGYGKMGPKTMLGKTVTMIYAAIGIPLMLIYLSSIGNLLSDCTLSIFNKNLCCSCRNKNGKEKEKQRAAGAGGGERLNLEPFYIRSPSKSIAPDNYSCPENIHKASTLTINHFSNSNSMSFDPSGSSCYKSTFLSICLCLAIMVAYVCCGASVLCVLERNWSYLDGIFFCFMTLSTINFVDTVPSKLQTYGDMTVWFFSLYILSGMALTAMCFNIFHKEVVYRLETYSAPTPPPPLPLTKNDLVKPSVS